MLGLSKIVMYQSYIYPIRKISRNECFGKVHLRYSYVCLLPSNAGERPSSTSVVSNKGSSYIEGTYLDIVFPNGIVEDVRYENNNYSSHRTPAKNAERRQIGEHIQFL